MARAINGDMLVFAIDSIVFYVKSLFNELGGDTCHFVPRLSNEAAHILARESVNLANNLIWLYECPSCISHCILSDA